MWYLQDENDERVIYIAGKYSEVTIGRNTDPQIRCFVIPDDPSISRKHATLCNLNGELFLQDLGSRYGTFINNNTEQVESKSMIKLKDGDIVKFGKMNSIFKVYFKLFVTCTSTLKGENLQNLRQCLNNLSGTLKNEWDTNCQYLTMPAITLTMKVVLALVQGAHIVTVEFWNKCLEALNSQVILPDPNNFIPQVIESTLNKENVTFLPNDQRKTLFTGKRVVFFSKRQFEMYRTVLTNASATALLLSECKLTKSALCENNVIVIQYNMSVASQETQAQKNLIEELLNYLKSKGKRPITDVEIGLAILYCSTEKYCNPDFQFPAEIIKQSEQNAKLNNVLAQESQESNQNIQSHRENVVIDETLTTSNSAENTKCNNMKRKNCDAYEDQENNPKKMVITNIQDASNSGVKRKINEEDSNTNPSKKIASTDSQDNFNFVNSICSNNTDQHQDASTKRLNLIKPQKRKLESDDNEDDPFHFIKNKPKMSVLNKSNLFDSDKATENTAQTQKDSETIIENTKSMITNNVDLATLRGVKLEELMKSNERLLSNENTNRTKTPIKEELDEKMSELNLGITIVTIKKELIVKKEPKFVEEKNDKVKNFKKFKKVWPVKMQISIISSSSNNSTVKLSTSNLQSCVTEN